MKISGMVVSVDYADYLANSLQRWIAGLDSLIVVSTARDEETLKLCQLHDCFLYQTDAFYANGAVFNKGAAISEAVAPCNWLDDWQLLFDADIIPVENWRDIVEAAGCQQGHLYGAIRRMEDGSANRSDDFELPGYFQLFHAEDENAQRVPLMDCSWSHGGGYDSEFQARWSAGNKHRLPLTLTHQGPHGRHWWGRYRTDLMDAMYEERQRTHRIAKCERIAQ